MYIIDFIKRVSKMSNIPVLIYLILNVFVIAGFIFLFGGMETIPFWQALIGGSVLYLISMAIALSPIGEWILRIQTGCKKIKRVEQQEFIEPIFDEVYNKAKILDPTLPSDIKIYMNNDEQANAFATGRKTICITKGMLYMPENQIKATLAHEFGHLANKDTDLILIVSVGNLIVSAFILFMRLIIGIIKFVFDIIFLGMVKSLEDTIVDVLISMLIDSLIAILVTGVTWLWTQVGVLLVMKSSRGQEFAADEFSYKLGYGNELCIVLDSIAGNGAKGLFASLVSSHPDKDDRIAKLQELGATYRATYGSR